MNRKRGQPEKRGAKSQIPKGLLKVAAVQRMRLIKEAGNQWMVTWADVRKATKAALRADCLDVKTHQILCNMQNIYRLLDLPVFQCYKCSPPSMRGRCPRTPAPWAESPRDEGAWPRARNGNHLGYLLVTAQGAPRMQLLIASAPFQCGDDHLLD